MVSASILWQYTMLLVKASHRTSSDARSKRVFIFYGRFYRNCGQFTVWHRNMYYSGLCIREFEELLILRGQVDWYLYSCIVNSEDKDIGEERTEKKEGRKKGGSERKEERERKKEGRAEGKEKKRLNDSPWFYKTLTER